MAQQFLPHLRAQTGALIVNISSGLAGIPFPAASVYCAAKAEIHSYTQSLRVQLHGTGMTVAELAPPGVETPLLRGDLPKKCGDRKRGDPVTLSKRFLCVVRVRLAALCWDYAACACWVRISNGRRCLAML